MDARGNAIDETLGTAAPAIGIISGVDPLTGLIDYRTAGTGSPYSNRQNLSFEWDKAGNLTRRIDGNQSNLTEAFFYDGLNRLDYSTRNTVTNLNLDYDPIGNITYKSDAGSYYYHPGKPYAVDQIGANCGCGCINTWQYSYDNNGNMTGGLYNGVSFRTITWKSFDMPDTITQGSSSSAFSYTPSRERWKQVASYNGTAETTLYIGGLMEKMTRGGVTEYKHYIPAGQSAMAIHPRPTSPRF